MLKSKLTNPSRRSVLKTGATAAGVALAAPNFFVGKAHAATEKLSVGIIPSYSFAMYWLIQDQGLAPGIEMDFSVFPSGPPAIEAMLGGSLDVVTVGSVPPIAGMVQKVADFRAFSICADASGLFQIVAKPGTASLAALEGKKIAVTSGSNFDYFLEIALQNEGLSDMPLERVNMEPQDAQAAFVAGAVDATVPIPELNNVIFDRLPDAAVIADGAKMSVDKRPSIMDIILTTQQNLDAKEAAYVELLSAYHDKAVAMLREDNATVVERMVHFMTTVGNVGVTAKEVEPLLNGHFFFNTAEIKSMYSENHLKNVFQKQSEFLVKHDRIPSVPDLDALVSNQIIQKI